MATKKKQEQQVGEEMHKKSLELAESISKKNSVDLQESILAHFGPNSAEFIEVSFLSFGKAKAEKE